MDCLFTQGEGANLSPSVAGGNFPQCLYGNQQVSLTTEKKWGLSYKREKEGQPPLHPHLPLAFFFPVGVAAATAVTERKSEG